MGGATGGGTLCAAWPNYLDGSFRGGPSALLGRTGFAFVALDQAGEVRAAAYGVPPPWVHGIHGAELWALFAALRCTELGAAYRSDRAAVVSTFKEGAVSATASSDEHARLWGMVFAACDDWEHPETQLDLEWMPAHTTEADVGRACLSNGQPLTARDRKGNALADAYAKRGAELHRVPEEVRRLCGSYEALAVWAARELAIRTHAANNCRVPGRPGPCRDSTGLPRPKRRSRPPGRPGASPAPVEQPRPGPPPPAALHGAEGSPAGSTSSDEAPVPLRAERGSRRRAYAAERRLARAEAEEAAVRRAAERARGARPALTRAELDSRVADLLAACAGGR